jgi:hypothetical protein
MVVVAGVAGTVGVACLCINTSPSDGIVAASDDLRTTPVVEVEAPLDPGPKVDAIVLTNPAAAPPADIVDGGPCVMQKPLSEVALAEVLQTGYEAFFGHAPTANRLACAWAHCAFEHGRGKKMFGNNLGHITTTGAWRGPTCVKSFTERVGTNPDRWTSTTQTFRVHPTLAAGAIDYWKLMQAQYPGVLIACDRGDALVAARELRRRHYFTGPENRYVRSLAQLYLEALGSVIPKTERPAWPIGPKR